ncbi:DDB1- and CUL4-associated factor 12-like [Patiria miniata]|uniref:DDB1- and CUL4-associated factor 12 beta-propeller domain-containing protein n=1 Tax=Patiria miniata TaxID=46514 RepID=A0A914BRJ8_PATMI|nr:DDB1- and CUL4-associated factor 12-like [Patiria miniata]XP_038078253.1 DDB1- and CUL4-associated factor 12-like [Patiria miniata]XP_038078254.1 DDB1- and CUL4-associated factor 12-like [Patiria miniata]XP_038078256.1 DDB1- and CUL4-associated factor 12-like [Patiria miniata]
MSQNASMECDYEQFGDTGYEDKVSVFQYTQKRQIGKTPRISRKLDSFAAKKLPYLLREKEISLGTTNKVFASEWLSDRQVVFGTKCNKLIVLDVYTGQQCRLPVIKSRTGRIFENGLYTQSLSFGGIHSIAINPSKTLLATGADNPDNVALYKLPSFDPVYLGENCHEDWIFSIAWLDDQYFVTGSRDSSIALWSINETQSPEDKPLSKNVYLSKGRFRGSSVRNYSDDEESWSSSPDRFESYHSGSEDSAYSSTEDVSSHTCLKELARKSCQDKDKVRALQVNEFKKDLAVLTSNGFIYTIDMESFDQKDVEHLTYCQENVCIALSRDNSLYAVGSQSHVTFLDPRTLKSIASICSKERGSGVRSVSFREEIVTIGTGKGTLRFFDIRNRRYLPDEARPKRECILQTGSGHLNRDDMYFQHFYGEQHENAAYTHCYDKSGTRLFVAGGPLPAGLSGNYAALWQ